jgi:hypothetical protein
VERLEEVSNSVALEEALEAISARDLILAPVDRLILPKM